VNDLNRLIQRLCDADIAFVIVGGFAAMLHGSSLLTRDLDVCAVLTTENVEKLSFLDNREPGVEVRNLYLRTDIGPVDVLSSVLGVGDFERVYSQSAEIELFGRKCRVISLDDLIRAKEALGREKDLLAVKELRAIKEKAK
jgi:predicted nucleotidyltransferase